MTASTPAPATSGAYPAPLLRACSVVFLALVGFLWCLPPLLTSFHRFQRTYNEGWNVFRSAQVAKREPVYPAGNRFAVANYPPLSFHITSTIDPVFHDFLATGRV